MKRTISGKYAILNNINIEIIIKGKIALEIFSKERPDIEDAI